MAKMQKGGVWKQARIPKSKRLVETLLVCQIMIVTCQTLYFKFKIVKLREIEEGRAGFKKVEAGKKRYGPNGSINQE